MSGQAMSEAIQFGVFLWAVSVDDDEPTVVVTLGSKDDDAQPYAWFELDADAAQEMGGALIRAYGALLRRARALPPLGTDLNGTAEDATP
jgi:hypothetical protein